MSAAPNPEPLGSSRRRRLVFALLLAAFGHATVVSVAAVMPRPLWAVAGLRIHPELTIDPVLEVEVDTDTGGGSAILGAADRAEGQAPSPPEPEAAAATPTPPPEPPTPPEVAALPPPEVAPPEPEAPSAAPVFDEKLDWSGQNVLFAATADEESFAIKPRAAFARVAKQASFVRPLSGDQPPQNGRFRGTAPGANGGPGGIGQGLPAPVFVTEEFVFGGRDGAFLGRMCFIDENLKSLKALGACRTQLQFRTDTIDIPPRRFDQGFPGIPGRDEWFSILYTGTITVTRAGVYAFRVLSDDGSVLHIDGRPVVDNDGLHGPEAVEGKIELSEGPHRFELWYFQGPRMLVALQVFVTPPGQGEIPLQPTL